ncbi:MAG: histidinol-phosphate transaminase [Bacteroidia bacterium]
MKINQILRRHLQAVKPYQSARDEYKGADGVFLDANENSLGTVGEGDFNRYPDPYQMKVRAELSRQKDLGLDSIFLGNGSDEIIDLLIRAFCEPHQDKILIMPPTFGMYLASASVNGVELVEAPLKPGFEMDLPLIKEKMKEQVKIIFICSPNNPTGNLMNRDLVIEILENFEGLVVVDEAYIDFSPEGTILPLVKSYDNLFVLQTFSKAWGMASLRLGMGFGNPEVVNVLNKMKMPYNVNGLTQQFAYEALLKADEKEEMVSEILEQKKWLFESLNSLPLVKQIYPSDANFYLVKFDDPDQIYQDLIAEKIITRNRSRQYLCEGCLRITVGTKEENQTLIAALKKMENE